MVLSVSSCSEAKSDRDFVYIHKVTTHTFSHYQNSFDLWLLSAYFKRPIFKYFFLQNQLINFITNFTITIGNLINVAYSITAQR